MADLIGKDIGRYHIIEQVGEGGMATVYKAFDTRLERDVAIKVIRTRAIPPDQLDKLLKRFEREAKRMAKFTHLNIVPIIDYGEYENAPYLVMPYLQGGTLKNLLAARAGKPLSVQEAAAILAPVARALEYAHEQETIHRDVKPANILLTSKGQPMLTDFGVAKILDLDEGQTLTGTGVGVGTPKYMAPEQWENQVLPQTDVYGLGVVLYEMLTGKVPYDAETPAGVHKKLLTEALLRPRTLNPSISEEAERVIYKAMAKDPLQRYADMGAMAQALERLGQAALSPALHPQAGVGNETTIDYGSAAQPYSKDEPYRTVSFLETSSAEPQSTWIGKRSDPPQTKPQPPKLMVEQEKKPSG
ncbi:MAG: serine/threonine-protein kinase, partial [Chloroflexota bacterium]